MHRYFTQEYDGEFIVIRDNFFHHLKNIIKIKIGEHVECIYNNKLFLTEIYKFEQTSVKLKIIKEIKIENTEPKLIAIVGLIREQKFDFLLQKLTEIGIDEIYPFEFKRSLVKIDNGKKDKKNKRWNDIIINAAQQSKQIKIPFLHPVSAGFDTIKAIHADVKIIAWEEENETDLKSLKIKNKSVAFVVGPEGGIDVEEIARLKAFGYKPISLGSKILRAETASIFLLSILKYLTL